MMTESNNLLYHPNDAAFDRLEEMEGGALTRYPVLRSVPVPSPRPWSTRGAIALLLVCGVVFGVIAAVSMGGAAPDESDVANTENQASTNIAGAPTTNGSGSLGATNIDSGSLWHDDSNSDSAADELLESPSESASDDSSASSALDDSSKSVEESVEAWIGSNASSTFEDVVANPFEDSASDSLLGSFEGSASDAESASEDNTLDVLLSGSASTDASVGSWFVESNSASEGNSWGDSASAADWDSFSPSTSALSSQSDDSSLGF